MKLLWRKRGLLLTLGLLAILLGVPMLLVWRQYRLDRDLIAAVKRNDTRAALSLLNQGADANVHEDSQRVIPLWRMIWDRFRGRPVSDNNIPTPLLLLLEPTGTGTGDRNEPAYLPENFALVNALLDHGAKVDAQNPAGWTPLNLAILGGKNATIHLLLARGADVRPTLVGKGNYRSVPLIWACASPRCSLAEITDLLDHGANINELDSLGHTPLFAAVTRFRPEVVRLLLARHADLSPKDIHGRTVLAWAHRFPHAPALHEITPLLEQAAAGK